jgi:hypothetical protein
MKKQIDSKALTLSTKSSIAIPQPWRISKWVRLPALGLLAGWLLQFSIVTSNAFQSDVVEGDWFIDVATGSDGNTGLSEDQAWASFDNLCANVGPGDIVLVRAGTYSTTTGDGRIINIPASCSGTAGNLITVKNYPGESPQIGTLPADNAENLGFVFIGGDYWRIEGLIFAGFEGTCINVAHALGDGTDTLEVVGNTFDQCGRAAPNDCLESFGHNAIFYGQFTDGTLTEGNLFKDSGRVVTSACDGEDQGVNHMYRHDHHMYIQGRNHIVRNNVFLESPAGSGIKIDFDDQANGSEIVSPDYSIVIINNTFSENVSLQPYDGCDGTPIAPAIGTNTVSPFLSWKPRWLAANNIFIEPTTVGATSNWKRPWQLFKSKSSCRSAVKIQEGVTWQDFGNDSSCQYNITTGTNTTSTCSEDKKTVADSMIYAGNVLRETVGNLDFYDVANDDYHLGASSTAIEAGNCAISATLEDGRSAAPTKDFDGKVRSVTTCDVGAYER